MSVASAAAAATAAASAGAGNGSGSNAAMSSAEQPTTPVDMRDEDTYMSGTSPKPPSSPIQGSGMANGAAAIKSRNANTTSTPGGGNGTAAKPLVLNDDEDDDEDDDETDEDDESSEADVAPIPPPHGSTNVNSVQEPLQQQPERPKAPFVDPESFKDAGNRFFKAKDYNRAIQEYTKGKLGQNSCVEQKYVLKH